MEERTLRPYKNFRWIVADPELLGGKLAVRGTRFSVSFILSCMSEGMTVEDIEETYGRLPHDAMPEVMRVASEILDAPNVAACGRVWNRGTRRGRPGVGRTDEWRVGRSAGQAGLRVIQTRDRLFSESAARALPRFPEFCVVLVTILQLRGPEFLNQFRHARNRGPIHPVAGKLLRWPDA